MEENRNITPEEYTDKAMWAASRLAYIKFEEWDYNVLDETLGDLLEIPDFFDFCVGDWGEIEPGSLKEAQYEETKEFFTLLKTDPIYSNWKIKDYKNGNEENGFCAITIETDADSAFVGFRGSENGIENALKRDPIAVDDWIIADVGLLDSPCTSQQASAEALADRFCGGF